MCRRKSKWRALSSKPQRVVTRHWREVSGLIPAIDIILSKPFWGKGLIQSHAGQNHEPTNPTAGRKSFRVLNTRELEPPQGPEGRLSEWMWDFSGSAAACLRTRCKERCERGNHLPVWVRLSASVCMHVCFQVSQEEKTVTGNSIPDSKNQKVLTDRPAGWLVELALLQPAIWVADELNHWPAGWLSATGPPADWAVRTASGRMTDDVCWPSISFGNKGFGRGGGVRRGMSMRVCC